MNALGRLDISVGSVVETVPVGVAPFGVAILPLQLLGAETPDTLDLSGREEFAIEGIENGEAREVTVRADDKTFRARVRLDTPRERDYLRHGGILRYVLRRLLAS
jgi:aconitate hydratase